MRVVVLGPGAAGKSTFSRRLSEATEIEAVELDSVFWSPDLTPMSPDDWVETQLQLTGPTSWILDGDLGPYDVLATRLQHADTVVLFDVVTWRCVIRALRRSRERWDFWRWLLTWHRREKPRLRREIEMHAPDASVRVVRSDREAEQLIIELAR